MEVEAFRELQGEATPAGDEVSKGDIQRMSGVEHKQEKVHKNFQGGVQLNEIGGPIRF